MLPLDGSIPAIKLSTYRRRLNSESEVRILVCKCNHCTLFTFFWTYFGFFFFSFFHFLGKFFILTSFGLWRQVTQDDRNLQNVTSLRRNMGSEFSCMIKKAKVLGLALGIPCFRWVMSTDKVNFFNIGL